MKIANFGISGDTTQGVLWHLQNGEGQGYKPKAVMLMFFMNINDKFLDEKGGVIGFRPSDKLHPAKEGYEIWASPPSRFCFRSPGWRVMVSLGCPRRSRTESHLGDFGLEERLGG